MNNYVIKGNAQFVQKVTFEPLEDFKQNHYGSWYYYKSCYFWKFSSPELQTDINRWFLGATQKYELRVSFNNSIKIHQLFLYKEIFGKMLNHVKDTLKVFDGFKNKQKGVWSNVFWYEKACIFWKWIQYAIHWDKTKMLKKLLRTIKRYKECPHFSFASSNSSQFYF